MDLGMSSDCAACLVEAFCGISDFPTAERAMPHMKRRAATRKRLILASGIRKRILEPQRRSRMWGRLALVVRKESNFDPVLCGLSLLVFPESVAGPYQYLLASDHGGRPIRRSRSVAHVLREAADRVRISPDC